MTFLNKEAILAADDREYDVVQCPEWGGELRIRSVSGRERDEYEQTLIQDRGGDRKVNLANARARLVALVACDENGNKIFTKDDVNALGRKNARPLSRAFDAAKKIAGMTDDEIDRLTENFDELPDGDSASA